MPLKEAHESGGSTWSDAKKQDYANSLATSEHLIAVKASANRSKGAKDPAEWLPPNAAYRHKYAKIWVAIKRRWGLSADPAESAALLGPEAGLATICPGNTLAVRHILKLLGSRAAKRLAPAVAGVERGSRAAMAALPKIVPVASHPAVPADL